MNLHANQSQFRAVVPTHDDHAERAIVAALLVTPNRIGEVLAKVQPHEFGNPFLGRVVAVVSQLTDEGRQPSLQAVKAVIGSDEEISPGVSVHRYLGDLMVENITAGALPIGDALEVVRDLAQRNALASIGTLLTAKATSQSAAVGDIASEAVHQIDDVISSLRAGRRQAYDAAGAADIALRHLSSEDRTYPTTGLADLDAICGGWPLGQLSIWAGRPGMGKSACATGAVLRASSAGHGVGFFSLEMQGEQLGARLMTDLAYTNREPIFYEDIINRRDIGDNAVRRLMRASEAMRGLPVSIEEQRGLTLAEIQARSRKMANEFDRQGRKLACVFVDHLGLVRASARYRGNRVNEVMEISDGLATMAKELDCAVIALCQLNRAVEGRENKRPSLSDLRDSGALEQDASLVIFTYRPAYYLEQRLDDPEKDAARQRLLEQTRNKLELFVAKNRNGRCGTVDAFVDIGANAIRNASYVRHQ